MFRSLALVCFTAVFAFSTVFAQDEPEFVPIKATPEILALFDDALQSLAQAEPNYRVDGLFQLLGFAVDFDNKASAEKVVNAIVALAPSIEPEALRGQLFLGVASALCDMGKYTEAIAILNRIADPTERAKAQLSTAVHIVASQEHDKTLPPFDVSVLLRQVIGGAVEAKDTLMEALARLFLANELARQDKPTESAAAFAEALRTARGLEKAEERGQVIGMILQRQVEHHQLSPAVATWQTVAPENKEIATIALVSALIKHEKFAEAEGLLKTLAAGDVRDDLLGSFIMETIKTIADAKVAELSALVSTEDRREHLLQMVVRQLASTGRNDEAVQVGKRLKDPNVGEMALLIGKVGLLLEEKKFAEAIKYVEETEKNEAIRQSITRQILVVQFRETRDEAVADQIAATFTSGEKVASTELREEATQTVTDVTDVTERLDVLFEIVQAQNRFLDFVGARQTLKLISDQLDATQSIESFRDRLLLAQMQVDMHDKAGAKANLVKLVQTLSAIRNWNELKDLVPAMPSAPGAEQPVDVPAIQNQLFQIYFMSASLLARADAPAESQAAFAMARELAKTEPNAAEKADKLLALAQFLAEQQK
ncbi:MAG: hypothetical protein FWE95_05365 [Planctomycetaceae bacterium]|nr:hypothetical protein [Planctomycetaceae bacterium]